MIPLQFAVDSAGEICFAKFLKFDGSYHLVDLAGSELSR